MALLTNEEKDTFQQNGYLLKHGMVSEGLIARAVEAIWNRIDADKEDASTWVRGGKEGKAKGEFLAITCRVCRRANRHLVLRVIVLVTHEGDEIGRGTGTFMRSHIPLSSLPGYLAEG